MVETVYLGLSCASRSGLACCVLFIEYLQTSLGPDALMNASRLRLAMASTSSTTLGLALMPPRTMLAQTASVQQLSTLNDPSRGAQAGNLVAVIVYLVAVACSLW